MSNEVKFLIIISNGLIFKKPESKVKKKPKAYFGL